MLKQMLPELRAWANEVGVRWRDVVRLKAELIELERHERYLTDDVRRTAWASYCHWNMTPGCLAFWRCGWDHVRRNLDRKNCDFTSIPRFDLIHRAVADEHPEWANREAEELFEWLMHTPYEPWPGRQEFYERAIARFEEFNACSSFHDRQAAVAQWGQVEY